MNTSQSTPQGSEEEELIIIIDRQVSILNQLKLNYLGWDAKVLTSVFDNLKAADQNITAAADTGGASY